MIVVDTNVIAYLLSRGPNALIAEACRRADPDWHVPVLWRSEYRNVLALEMRRGMITLAVAQARFERARRQLSATELEPDGVLVLELASHSGLTAYDCEFVAVARQVGKRLVTADRAIVRAFAETAVLLEEFAA